MTPKTPLPMDYATPAVAPKGRFRLGLFGWILFIGLAVMFVLLMRRSDTPYKPVTLTQFYSDIETGNVRTVYLSDGEVNYVTIVNGSAGFAGAYRSAIPQGMEHDWNFVHWMIDNHNSHAATVEFNSDNNLVVNLLMPLIPWLLIFFFIWFFVFRQRQKNSMQAKQPMPVYIVNPEAMQ